MSANASQAGPKLDSHAVFVRVYPLDAKGLTKPVMMRSGRMLPDQNLGEIGAQIEMEITIGVDGKVRDALIKKSRGGQRVEAHAIRSAFNSYFEPAAYHWLGVRADFGVRYQRESRSRALGRDGALDVVGFGLQHVARRNPSLP